MHSYSHEAMNTTFTLRIFHKDAELCDSAAQGCIALIDEIENRLSRYVEGSDVWQINQMQAGDTLLLSELCYDCIEQALDTYVKTEGLFDVTLGKQIEHKKSKSTGQVPPLEGQLMLDPDRPAIHCIQAGRHIDLGGIGKGFTLDQIHKRLLALGIDDGLLAAGASTQLAFGSKAWEIQLQGDKQRHIVTLKNQALSASGSTIQGSHIVSPSDENTREHYAYERIWVLHHNATLADAWSTATLLMSHEEMKQAPVSIYSEEASGIEKLKDCSS